MEIFKALAQSEKCPNYPSFVRPFITFWVKAKGPVEKKNLFFGLFLGCFGKSEWVGGPPPGRWLWVGGFPKDAWVVFVQEFVPPPLPHSPRVTTSRPLAELG